MSPWPDDYELINPTRWEQFRWRWIDRLERLRYRLDRLCNRVAGIETDRMDDQW